MRLKLNLLIGGMLVAALTLVTGSTQANYEEESLQIKGSDTMVNLVQAWAEEFMMSHPAAFIAVTGGGSGTGISSLISGTCNIAQTSRVMKNREIKMAQERGVEPVKFEVGLDGIAVVVHPDNPVSELTLEQLAKIFMGQIRNWNELGGADLKIVLLSREVNSGTHVFFKEHVLRVVEAGAEFTPEALLLPSSQAIADEIAHNSNAIGYYGMGYISARQKAIAISGGSSENAFLPTVDNVISGAYPISRPLLMYTRGEPQGTVRVFMDFIFSTRGQEIVEEIDFVPLKPAE